MRNLAMLLLKLFIIAPFMALGWLWAMARMSFKLGHDTYMQKLRENVTLAQFYKQGDLN